MGGVKVFAGQGGIPLTQLELSNSAPNFLNVDLPERESLIQHKRDVIARFLHVLLPLVSIYKIPQTSLHIFADKEGQLVAFNRGGSLFVNLRYYEAWRMFRISLLRRLILVGSVRRSRCPRKRFQQGLHFLVRVPRDSHLPSG